MSPAHRWIGSMAVAAFGCGMAIAGPAAASSTSPAVEATNSASSSSATVQCTTDFTEAGVAIRALPQTDAAIRGHGNPGDCATSLVQARGDYVRCPDGGSTNWWFDIRNERSGVRGWVSSCYIR